MNVRKIALFLPGLMGGGAERVMVDLANGFIARNFQVDLVVAGVAEGPYSQDISPAVKVIEFNTKGRLQALPSLVKYLKKEKPDVLLATLTYANIIAILAKLLSRFKGKLFVREANHFTRRIVEHGRSYFLLYGLTRILYRYATRVIAVSEEVKTDLFRLKIARKTLVCLYNPVVSAKIFAMAAQEVNHQWFQDETVPIIVAIGRLIPQKDFTTLLQAVSILHRKRKTRLMILGEGAEREALIQLAQELNIDKDVEFGGFVRNPFKYLSRASLFVLSSKYEGLPGVLIQAMALGIAVISTHCPGGSAEILDGGRYGILTPVGRADLLAQAMARQLEAPIVSSNTLQKRAQMLFNYDDNVDRYCDLIQEG